MLSYYYYYYYYYFFFGFGFGLLFFSLLENKEFFYIFIVEISARESDLVRQKYLCLIQHAGIIRRVAAQERHGGSQIRVLEFWMQLPVYASPDFPPLLGISAEGEGQKLVVVSLFVRKIRRIIRIQVAQNSDCRQ